MSLRFYLRLGLGLMHVQETVANVTRNGQQLHHLQYVCHHTKVYWSLTKAIELIQSAIDRDIAHKMEGIFIFCWWLCIKLKHLLSASDKRDEYIFCYGTIAHLWKHPCAHSQTHTHTYCSFTALNGLYLAKPLWTWRITSELLRAKPFIWNKYRQELLV